MPPSQALRTLLDLLGKPVDIEIVALDAALGRVTRADILAPENLPVYPRSAMDGYSLIAADTFGASEGLPAYLSVLGEVKMGMTAGITVSQGQAAAAFTGGMLANGADAVVMVENTQRVDEHTIEVVRPTAPGENVIQVGEDVAKGDQVMPAGHVLRPQDLGGLSALGITKIKAARRPRVAILSMGDELIPPNATPEPGQIRDINTYTISASVRQAGGEPVPLGLAPDDFEVQIGTAKKD